MKPAVSTDRAGRMPIERIADHLERPPFWADPKQMELPLRQPGANQ